MLSSAAHGMTITSESTMVEAGGRSQPLLIPRCLRKIPQIKIWHPRIRTAT